MHWTLKLKKQKNTNISWWKSGATHLEDAQEELESQSNSRAFGDKGRCLCWKQERVVSPAEFIHNVLPPTYSTQTTPLILIICRVFCCYECISYGESLAALFIWERPSLEKVRTQLSAHFLEFMSGNSHWHQAPAGEFLLNCWIPSCINILPNCYGYSVLLSLTCPLLGGKHWRSITCLELTSHVWSLGRMSPHRANRVGGFLCLLQHWTPICLCVRHPHDFITQAAKTVMR